LRNPISTIVFILLAFLQVASSLAAQPLVIDNANRYLLDETVVEILRDDSRLLTIEEVASPRYAKQFFAQQTPVANFGMTDSAFWFRFTIDPGNHGSEPWLLLLDQPLMNQVDLYIPRDDGRFDRKRSGDLIPMSSRDLHVREIVLPLPLEMVTPRTYYLRAWISGRSQMPITIMTQTAFQQHSLQDEFLFGGYAGFMLAMMMFGVALYAIILDRNYLLYVFMAMAILLTHFGINGFIYTYLLPEHPQLHEYVVIQLCTLTIMTGLIFARRFLRLAEYAPAFHRLFGWYIGVNLLMLLGCHFIPTLIYKKMLNFNFMAATMLALIAAFISYRKGFVQARFYAYGRCALSVSGLVYPLANEGFLPINGFTKNSLLIASVGDVIFIMMALGHHFYVMSRQVRTLVVDLEREVEERSAVNRSLQEQMAERRRLELEIEQVGREERRRISYKLHDGLCQLLTGTSLRFAALEDRLIAVGLQNEARPLGDLLKESVNHAYALSRRLWNSDDVWSESVIDLDKLVRQLSAQSGIPVHLTQENNCPACSDGSMLHIQQIAREALINSVKHSGATLITVSLCCSPDLGIRLEVRDNGGGNSMQKTTDGGLGIGMMEYRASIIGARLEISVAKEGGTVVICTAPCNKAQEVTCG